MQEEEKEEMNEMKKTLQLTTPLQAFFPLIKTFWPHFFCRRIRLITTKQATPIHRFRIHSI